MPPQSWALTQSIAIVDFRFWNVYDCEFLRLSWEIDDIKLFKYFRFVSISVFCISVSVLFQFSWVFPFLFPFPLTEIIYFR